MQRSDLLIVPDVGADRGVLWRHRGHLGTAAAAEYAGVTEEVLRGALHDGTYPGTVVAAAAFAGIGGGLRWRVSDLDAWIASRAGMEVAA